MSRRGDNLAEEINSLESQLYVSTAAATPEEPEEEALAASAPEVPQEETPTEEAPQSTELSEEEQTYEKRYKNLRAAQSAQNFKYKQQLAAQQREMDKLTETLNTMSQKLAEVQATPKGVKDIFEAEELDILGDATAASIVKANRAAVEEAKAPLEAKIKALEAQISAVLKTQKVSESEREAMSFRRQLGRLAPNFESIDVNPKFLKWMQGPEHDGGPTREYLFKNAQAAGDVKRVAGFFNEFEALHQKPVTSLEKQVSPTSAGSPAPPVEQPNQPKIYSFAEVNQFYDDCARGKFRGRRDLKDKLEAQYELALREKRVR